MRTFQTIELPHRYGTAADVCGDCAGTGVSTDDDGSVTGTVGTSFACICTGDYSGTPCPSPHRGRAHRTTRSTRRRS